MNDNNMQKIFLESYEAYSDAIFRYCYFKTSDRELALDLTQETFTKTWQYMANGKEIENIRAFLYRVAGNLIIDSHRKKKATSLDAMREDGFDKETDEHENQFNNLIGEEVIKALNELDEDYKEILTLRFIEDLSIEEIEKVTGISTNNISVRIHRALSKLKEGMK